MTESGVINEYAHGGTSIIQTLTPPSNYVNLGGCSVDPTTSNLAVSASNTSGLGAILITPALMGAPRFILMQHCSITITVPTTIRAISSSRGLATRSTKSCLSSPSCKTEAAISRISH